jgi:hypothetical protein
MGREDMRGTKETKETRETKQPKPRRKSSANAVAPPTAAPAPSAEAIARRAHELFQARGGLHGRDMDDWLEAERQIGAGMSSTARRS